MNINLNINQNVYVYFYDKDSVKQKVDCLCKIIQPDRYPRIRTP